MTEHGRSAAGPARCARCGGEMRFTRRPLRAEFGGQWVRVEVETSECTGCGDLQYHRAAERAATRSEPPAGGGAGRQEQRRSEERRS